MIIFLHGPDNYRLREKLKDIVEQYKRNHKSGLNLKFLDGAKLDYQDFKEEFQQASMFKEKKLVVLNDVLDNEEFKKSFLENYQKFAKSDDIIVFCEEKEVSVKDPLVKLLLKEAKTQDFPLLNGAKLKNWIRKETDKYGLKLDPQAVDKLSVFVGNDLWQLDNEIKKLAAYKKGGRVSNKDIGLLVKPKIEPDIFKTIDAIAKRDKKTALALIHQHLEKGDNPIYLLHMINYQFRNMLVVKDLLERGKSPNQAKLHPFVVRKSLELAQKFTLEELKKIYHKIFKADFNIKTGKLESEAALDLLIAEI